MTTAADLRPVMRADKKIDWPELTLPDAEAKYLRRTYRDASVILEYGSGSTLR